MKITSDWVVTYNRTYQQLGDEFLEELGYPYHETLYTPSNNVLAYIPHPYGLGCTLS